MCTLLVIRITKDMHIHVPYHFYNFIFAIKGERGNCGHNMEEESVWCFEWIR